MKNSIKIKLIKFIIKEYKEILEFWINQRKKYFISPIKSNISLFIFDKIYNINNNIIKLPNYIKKYIN